MVTFFRLSLYQQIQKHSNIMNNSAIKFHHNTSELAYQISLAIPKKNHRDPNFVCIVVITKLKPSSRKSFYGFRWIKKSDNPFVGKVLDNNDGSVSRIEAILNNDVSSCEQSNEMEEEN